MLAAAGLVLALAGCGRSGALEPPPDPSAPPPSSHDQQLSSLRRPRPVPIKPPDQPFLLDPLL